MLCPALFAVNIVIHGAPSTRGRKPPEKHLWSSCWVVVGTGPILVVRGVDWFNEGNRTG